MERRLRIARRLLKPDGVIVVTIDENEVHHLGMLLEQTYPDARIQMVTIAINPSGTSGDGLSRVDEYAFFASLAERSPTRPSRTSSVPRTRLAPAGGMSSSGAA